MRYFVWQQDWNRPVDVKDVTMPNGWSRSLVLMGQRIADDVPDLQVLLEKKNDLSDALINQWNWLIFSPKLRQVLSALTNDPIQYLAVVVRQGPQGKQIPGYQVCNPLVSIQAVDRPQSALVLHAGTEDIFGIEALVLDQRKIGDGSFFRLQEYAPALIVREDVVEGISRSHCTGMQFLPIEEYKR